MSNETATLVKLSAAEQAAAVKKGDVTSRELVEAHLKVIEAAEPSIKAFLKVSGDVALEQADAFDAKSAEDKAALPELAGVPIAIKDMIVTKGIETTAASKILEGWVPPYDATVIEKLKAAGMPILGKTNLDEFAQGSSTEHSAYQTTHNPWDTERVPGGSGGGSASAVAAFEAPIALGTDTGGSIRQPASFCGITGIKPTYGRVSRYGMIAYASSLDQAGPMARTAHDCATLLNAMHGFDERDSTSLQREREDFTRLLGQPFSSEASESQPLKGLRIGVPSEFYGAGLDAEVKAATLAAMAQLEQLGATVVDVHLPHTELSIPTYYVIAPAEASSNLSRFDGVRYGHRAAQYSDLEDMYRKSRSEGFGWEVKRRILVGTYVLSHGYYDAYYLQAQRLRRMIAQDYQNALAQCDVIMGPVAPTPAWRLGEKSDDPVQMYLADIYTLSLNLAGLPGMSVPCGFSSDERPIGLQIIGNYFDEARLLQVAHAFQSVTDWHQRKPEVAQ